MLLPSIFGNDLFDAFDSYFYPVFETRPAQTPERKLYGHHAARMMKTDVKETETGYEVDVDLPGFKKEQIELTLKDGYLTVEAGKGLEEEHKDDAHGRYIRRERTFGSMSRSFFVGEQIEQGDIKARFEDGVLRIFVPKKEVKKIEEKQTITIE